MIVFEIYVYGAVMVAVGYLLGYVSARMRQ